jgi:FtsP/CotA-like multicopper oxidase with cupredoxin domain
LSLLILNDLPANPPGERRNAFPHDEYELNIHTHGLIVSPLGNSDNIFRHMDPGTAHLMEVKIPEDHPTGTFWFHPHVHGTVTYQFLGGMAGFLIVRGGPGTLDAVPEVAAAKDAVMAFQVIRTTHDGNTVFVQEKSAGRDGTGLIPVKEVPRCMIRPPLCCWPAPDRRRPFWFRPRHIPPICLCLCNPSASMSR